MRSSSTLLTRLALALLAVLGFVAPLAAGEVNRVVQTAGGKPSAVEIDEASPAPGVALETADVVPPAPAKLLARGPAASSRRYLLHRAWLLLSLK